MSLEACNSLLKFQSSKRIYAVYFSEHLQKTEGNPTISVLEIKNFEFLT
jgi:hypothetical protein